MLLNRFYCLTIIALKFPFQNRVEFSRKYGSNENAFSGFFTIAWNNVARGTGVKPCFWVIWSSALLVNRLRCSIG